MDGFTSAGSRRGRVPDGRVDPKFCCTPTRTPGRRTATAELVFRVRGKGLDLSPGFAPPLVVTLVERPGTILRGTDRTGFVRTCTFTGGVPCVTPYGSTRSAFLVDPGASLTDP